MRKKAADQNLSGRQSDNKEDNMIEQEDNTEKHNGSEDNMINNMKNNKPTAAPDVMKLTFSPIVMPAVNKGVKENIKAFQLMEKGGECRFGSGSCAEHNVKLCRQVTSRRVGCVDKNGKTTWRMREVVTLACPAKAHQPGSTTTELSVHEELVGTNKKLRFDMSEKYQSQTDVSNQKVEGTDTIGQDMMTSLVRENIAI